MNRDEKIDQIAKICLKEEFTLGFAESCTGGLLSSSITQKSGSSAYFMGTIVSYSNDIKHRLLKVPNSLFEEVGAVSQEVAQKMAAGAREVLKTTWSLAITGIAGPNGGSKEKPVGTVWFAVCGPHFESTVKQHFTGSRKEIQNAAVERALDLLIEAFEKISSSKNI